MVKLGKLWAGKLYGTNTGNLFAEFQSDGATLSGKLRFMDPLFGLSIYEINGEIGSTVKFSGEPIQAPQGAEMGNITAEAKLSSDGVLRGEWQSSIGTAGTFDLHPHDSAMSEIDNGGASGLPEQLITRNEQLGAIRLYREDIDKLVSKMQADFSRAKPVVTFVDGDSEFTKYVDDFKSQVKDSRPLIF